MAKWDELAAIMEQEGRLTLSDGPWLETISEAYAEYRRWLAKARQSPLTVTKVNTRMDVDGGGEQVAEEKAHPAQQQARLAWESYRKLLAEGGLTPMSRARVSGGAQDTGEDLAESFLRAVK